MAGLFAFLDGGGHVFVLFFSRHREYTIVVRKAQGGGCRAFLIR